MMGFRNDKEHRPGYNMPGRYSGRIAMALLLLVPALAAAQPWENTGADAVVSFTPGTGAGHGAQYVPGNVLGLPDSAARADVATVSGEHVLSLGLGGEIVLRFDRHPIINRPGPDFTVFENAFRYSIGGKQRIYAEPAQVAVSLDGMEFIAFPFDSLTLAGCAGVGPTNGQHDPGNADLSGGDHFDIGQLGLDSVRFIRIRDISSIVKDNRQHPFWDPTLTGAAPTAGFDLDAVVRVTSGSVNPSGVEDEDLAAGKFTAELLPNPFAGSSVIRFRLDRETQVRARLFDPMGREIRSLFQGTAGAHEQRIRFDAADIPAGIYFVLIEAEGHAPLMMRAVHTNGDHQ